MTIGAISLHRLYVRKSGRTGPTRAVVRCSCVALVVATLACGCKVASAEAEALQGRAVRILVGFGAGGGYDIFARILARHLPRHIPGGPAVIVENRPGAGGQIAAEALLSSSAKDGTVWGLLPSNVVLDSAFGQKANFDVRRLNWLGSGSDDFLACIVRSDAGISNFDDALRKPIAIATQGVGSLSYAVPTLLNAVVGTKFEIISGYRSIPDKFMAMTRKDVAGLCNAYHSVLVATHAQDLEGPEPRYRIIVAMTERPSGRFLDGVASAFHHVRDDGSRDMMRIIRSMTLISYPFALPPDVDKARVETLRKAFAETLADRAFVREAEMAGQIVKPQAGDVVERIADQILSMSPETMARLKPVLGK